MHNNHTHWAMGNDGVLRPEQGADPEPRPTPTWQKVVGVVFALAIGAVVLGALAAAAVFFWTAAFGFL